MKTSAIGPEATNGAARIIADGQPYTATVTLKGSADLLLHRWNCEAVEAKSNAAKNSKAKKTDDVESFVYRDTEGFIGVPGEYVRQAVIHAAKFRQDPRSPRKSAADLYKAGVVATTQLALFGPKKLKEWDYLHKCRVTIQRNGITRVRPAFLAGWEITLDLSVILPEYIKPNDLHDVLMQAGKLIGIADFRPTYGRFLITSFDVGSV